MKSFDLEATAKGSDNSLNPFELSISEPVAEPTGEFCCFLDCPFFGFDGHRVYGVNVDQAMALALWLVEDQLNYRECVLVDDQGECVRLPIDRTAGVPGRESANPKSG